MSLEIARSIAVSSLMASQVQISVASSNISNADTTGYTVKTANQVATTSGGAGTGVSITGITSSVDKLLFKSLISATSELGAANTNNDYLNRLQALYGSTTGAEDTGTSIANTLASLESAISSLAGTTSSTSLQANVVVRLIASHRNCARRRLEFNSCAGPQTLRFPPMSIRSMPACRPSPV